MEKPANVLMVKDGQPAEVANNESIQIMQAQGWELVDEEGSKKPSEGLKVDEIKAALAVKGVTIPDTVTLKADLAALLDSQPST